MSACENFATGEEGIIAQEGDVAMATYRTGPNFELVLPSRYPSIPIITEEAANAPYEERKDWDYFW